MIELTEIDIDAILDEKPYDIDTAIQYADDMTMRYNKLYCVIKDNKSKKLRNYHIVGFDYYRDNIVTFELYYITKIWKK